jgi:hypothetical protein
VQNAAISLSSSTTDLAHEGGVDLSGLVSSQAKTITALGELSADGTGAGHQQIHGEYDLAQSQFKAAPD